MAEFLKALFSDGEALTYDQLMEKASVAGITPVNLADGQYMAVSKHTTKTTALNAQIKDLQDQIDQRDADLTDMKSRLDAATADAGKLSEAQSALTALQNKYIADKEAFEGRLTAQRREFAIREKSHGLKFSSAAAEKVFMADANAMNFATNEDGALLGWDEFLTNYREKNADSFIPDVPDEPAPTEPAPVIVAGSNINGGKPSGSVFSFGFQGVRPHSDD